MLAMTRVAIVMFYLSDDEPQTQEPVQNDLLAEMEQHRIVLRHLEEERLENLRVRKRFIPDDVDSDTHDLEGKKHGGNIQIQRKKKVDSVENKEEEEEENKKDDLDEILEKALTKGRWLHDEMKFPITPTDGCPSSGTDVFLLSLVLSYPKNREERQAIRDSFGGTERAEGKNVQTIFFVGTPPNEPLRSQMAKKLQEENDEFGDILQTSVFESIKKTNPPTTRLLAAFKWVILNCPLVNFVLIGNDELFVNIPNMVKILSKADGKTKQAYMGRSKKNARPQREKREWDFVPEDLFKGEFYPQYCVGGAGFVVSKDFIRRGYMKMMQNPNKAKKFPLGDVYLGIIAQELKIYPRYNDNFRKAGGEATYCDLRDAVTMGEFNSAKKLHAAWSNATTPIDKCPPAFPTIDDVKEWSKGVNNKRYFDKVLHLSANPKDACARNENTKTTPYLLALVSSQPEHFDLRDAIRKTWGAPRYMSPLNARTLFVLGRSKNQTQAMADRVLKEARTKGDIILADFNESFHNLTLKVVLGLRWVTHNCNQIKYIYKGDDDMLVNFGRIIDHLEHIPRAHREFYFLGHMMTRSPVVRTGQKYFVSRETYPFKYFLPYFSGGGYIFSQAAANAMYESSLSTKLIPIDDAYAGILAFRTNITLRGSNDFITTGSRKDACRLRTAFNLHGFKRTEIMINTWTEFLDPSNKCD